MRKGRCPPLHPTVLAHWKALLCLVPAPDPGFRDPGPQGEVG